MQKQNSHQLFQLYNLRIIVFVGEDKAGLAAPGNEAEVVLASIAEAPGVVAHIRL